MPGMPVASGLRARRMDADPAVRGAIDVWLRGDGGFGGTVLVAAGWRWPRRGPGRPAGVVRRSLRALPRRLRSRDLRRHLRRGFDERGARHLAVAAVRRGTTPPSDRIVATAVSREVARFWTAGSRLEPEVGIAAALRPAERDRGAGARSSSATTAFPGTARSSPPRRSPPGSNWADTVTDVGAGPRRRRRGQPLDALLRPGDHLRARRAARTSSSSCASTTARASSAS